MSKKQIIKQSSILVILTFFSRIFGLVREMVKAAYLGTTAFSDAFTIAFMIPNLLRRLFAEGSIAVAFIPVFKGYFLKDDKREIKEFLSAFFTFLSCAVTITVVVGIVFTPEIVGLTDAIQNETSFLTRIMFPYLAFVSIAAFFQGILNTAKVFAPSGFVPILFNISVIVFTIVLSPYMANPARAMAIGVIVGGMLQAVFQLPYVLKRGFTFSVASFSRIKKNTGVRKVLRLIGPVVIGMAAYQLGNLITSVIATKAGEGVASSLQFSIRLQELLLGVFEVSIGTVILSELSENAKLKQWDKFNEHLAFAMKVTSLIMIPALFFSLINRYEIISLLFQRKSFTAESVALTAHAFQFHIIGLFFIAAQRVIAPAFFAQENTKLPAISGIISLVVNVVIALLLYKSMKGGGIALASTIAAFVHIAILLFALLFKMGEQFQSTVKNFLGYALKIVIVSIVIIYPFYLYQNEVYGIFAKSSIKIISIGLPFLILTIIYFTILFIFLYVFKDPIIKDLINILKRKFSK